jgi:pyrroloquinoline-quinone synthase
MSVTENGTGDLVDRLRSQAERYHAAHPFHVRMNAGELSREQIEGWVANRFAYQEAIPIKDAAILSNCPDVAVRRRWIRRIIDHDGTVGASGTTGEDGGTVGGIEAWVRLGEACGVPRAEMLDQRHVVPGVRFAVDAYVTFARTKPWVIAVASSLTELFAPDLMANRLAAFEKYYTWIDPEGLQYFRNRLFQAPRDSEHALEVVLEHCRTQADQQAAFDALAFKNDVLWSMMDAIDLAYPA